MIKIKAEFHIISPITSEDLMKDFGIDDKELALDYEARQLEKEFSSILALDLINEQDDGTASISVEVIES